MYMQKGVLMPRPRRQRRIKGDPDVTYFKPAGIPIKELEEVTLSLEEFEAIRLIDQESFSQDEAGKKMGVSQSTLSRTLKEARQKIADAMVLGKAIRIEKG